MTTKESKFQAFISALENNMLNHSQESHIIENQLNLMGGVNYSGINKKMTCINFSNCYPTNDKCINSGNH